MTRRAFGTLPDGSAVEEVTLRAPGIEARVITWGAVLRDLVVLKEPDPPRHVVLGLNSVDDYLRYSRNFGAICGRVANRIAQGRMTIDGRDYALTTNFLGRHTLHGGAAGFSRRAWAISDMDAASATLDLVSPSGEEGFPGTVNARCVYRLEAPAMLRIILTAATDAPTALNLAPHPYFNLDGAATIDAHRLTIAADFHTPTDDEGIPTGEIRSVIGTGYDFRSARALGDAARPAQGYDGNLVLRRSGAAPGLFHVATLASPGGELAMKVLTTEPGLQLYDAPTLDLPVAGVDGRRYGPRAGLAIEPQRFPDAPHHSHFPSVILRPGETSRQESAFVFT